MIVVNVIFFAFHRLQSLSNFHLYLNFYLGLGSSKFVDFHHDLRFYLASGGCQVQRGAEAWSHRRGSDSAEDGRAAEV